MVRYRGMLTTIVLRAVAILIIIGIALIPPAAARAPDLLPQGGAALSLPGRPNHAPLPALESPDEPQTSGTGAPFAVTWPTNCGTPPPAGAVTALDYAANLWGTWLRSPVTITVTACWTTSVPLGALAAAEIPDYGRNFPQAPLVDVYYPAALANALAGVDLFPAEYDIRLKFQSAQDWDLSLNSSGAGAYDFVSVALHELAHGLGFTGNTYIDQYVPVCGNWPYGYLVPCPTPYDTFAVDSAGTPVLSYLDIDPLAMADILKSDTRFGGPNTVAANGGAARLYSPSTWQDGSSLSHLDQSTFETSGNRLMTPEYSGDTHVPGGVTLAMMQDIGWPRNDGVPNLSTSGATSVGVGRPAAFAAALAWDGYTSQPTTYTWTATTLAPVAHAGRGLTDTVALTWATPGVQTITATVTGISPVSAVRSVRVFDVAVTGPASAEPNQTLTFNAALAPAATTLPITYTWQRSDAPGAVVHPGLGTTDSMTFSWNTPGTKTVTVTATVDGIAVTDSHTVLVAGKVLDKHIYIPLVARP